MLPDHPLFLWAYRGAGGVSKGVTFIHRRLASIGVQPEDRIVEAYATIGVEPTVSMEEVTSPDFLGAKIKCTHPYGTQDLEERRVREDRTKCLDLACESIQKARQGQ